MSFRTRVQLPPGPLIHKYQNPSSNIKFCVSKNLFGLVLEREKGDTESFPLTIGGVCRWVKKEYGLDISKSSVCAVRDKCGANMLEPGAGKIIPKLKSEKELAVLEALKSMEFFAKME